eukprot:6018538-Pyramimonas_sp.AAC.1
MLARVRPHIREPGVRQWSAEEAQAWAAAVAGNSCLKEAYLRAVDEGLACTMGLQFGHGLLDVQEFYGAISWLPLAKAALRLRFPLVILYLER